MRILSSFGSQHDAGPRYRLIAVVFLSSEFLLQSSTFCSSQSHGHTSSHHTASQQYSHLIRTTFAAALLFTPSRSLRFRSLFLLLFVLLSGDTELNPGPSPFTLCTLNIRSILYPLHSAALSDLIDTHNPDLFCLTETWIKITTTAAELLNCTPTHYSLISTPRNGSDKITSSGGGTAFLIREPFAQLCSRFFIVRVIFRHSATFSFEVISLQYLSSSTFVHLYQTILCLP